MDWSTWWFWYLPRVVLRNGKIVKEDIMEITIGSGSPGAVLIIIELVCLLVGVLIGFLIGRG
jgi:hypothetical protein